MHLRYLFGLVLTSIVFSFSIVAWSQTDAPRSWTDVTGKHRIEATLERVNAGNVVLRRSDGSTLEVSLDRLSEPDRKWALAQASETKKPASKSLDKAPSRMKKSIASNKQPALGDWPQWRGPNRDGISQETGLLDSWPDGGPPLLWKVGGLGSGYSSVAVTQGKVFTMGRLGRGDKLIALDAQNGQPVWNTSAGDGGGPDPNGTPTVADELLFCVTCDGDLLCAETATGKEVWRKSFPRDFNGKMMSTWGYSESVLVDGDQVICTPGSQQAMLAALDKRTGRVIWTTSVPAAGGKGADGAGYSSVVISHAGGTKQYVQLVGRGVIGVDAKSGELLWGYNDVANGTANIPTPIVKDDYVFCSTGYDGGSALLKLTAARGRITPQVVYSLPANKTQNHHGGMLLIGKHIYMGHGQNNGLPLCIDFLTGKDAWRPGRGPGSGSAAVAYADGHLYFRYENGVMALIEATPAAYRLKGQFKIAINHGSSWPHPVIAGGRLYLRDQSELVCYDVRKQ